MPLQDAPPDVVDPPPPIEQPVPEPDKRPIIEHGKPGQGQADSNGLDPFLIGFLQWATPCAVYTLVNPVILLGSLVCPAIGCFGCLIPAAAGWTSTFIGDRFGRQRAPALWPIVAAYASMFVTAAAGLVVYVALIGGASAISSGLNNEATAFLVGIGVALAISGASTLAVPIAYAVTADDKKPGDDGSALPGLLEPNHDRPTRVAPRKAPPNAQTVMAY